MSCLREVHELESGLPRDFHGKCTTATLVKLWATSREDIGKSIITFVLSVIVKICYCACVSGFVVVDCDGHPHKYEHLQLTVVANTGNLSGCRRAGCFKHPVLLTLDLCQQDVRCSREGDQRVEDRRATAIGKRLAPHRLRG